MEYIIFLCELLTLEARTDGDYMIYLPRDNALDIRFFGRVTIMISLSYCVNPPAIEILGGGWCEDSTSSDVDFRSPRERDVGLDAWYRLVWSKP